MSAERRVRGYVLMVDGTDDADGLGVEHTLYASLDAARAARDRRGRSDLVVLELAVVDETGG